MAAEAPAASVDAASLSQRLDDDSNTLALQELLAFCSDDDEPLTTEHSQSPGSNSSKSFVGALTPDVSEYRSSSPSTGMTPDTATVAPLAVTAWGHVETRTGVHTPVRPVPHEVGDTDYLLDGTGEADGPVLPAKSASFDSDDGGSRSSTSSVPQSNGTEQERQREMRLGKRRRQRQRQRDELTYLGHHVEELKGQLERLRKHQHEFSQQTLVATKEYNLQAPDNDQLATLSGKKVWSQIATLEKEQMQTAVMENTRLRAQYECQLHIANGLKRLYQNQDSFSILDSSPDSGFLAKKLRTATISDDLTIFASLSRDFDAQFAQTDAIFRAVELSDFDGERVDEMLLKQNEHGAFYFDNLYSKVFPFEVATVSQVLWQCLTVEQLQSFHSSYNVLQCTEDTVHTKVINTVTLPDAETTLVIHIATKKYFEPDRAVCVWEGIIEAQGAVSMRLRETGWNLIRPAHALRPGQRGPVSIEQACVRITPEVQASTSNTETNFAVGTLTNLLIGSYHRRMEQVHHVADDLLAIQFELASLED